MMPTFIAIIAWLRGLKIQSVFMFSVMASMFGGGATVIYWTLAPYDILTGDEMLTIYNKAGIVESGGYLEYGRNWCKNTDRDAVVSREFVDGVRYVTPSVQPHYPKGCTRTVVLIQVPNIPPGTYRLHTSAVYQVNPLRWKTYEFWTPQFQIIPRNRVMRDR